MDRRHWRCIGPVYSRTNPARRPDRIRNRRPGRRRHPARSILPRNCRCRHPDNRSPACTMGDTRRDCPSCSRTTGLDRRPLRSSSRSSAGSLHGRHRPKRRGCRRHTQGSRRLCSIGLIPLRSRTRRLHPDSRRALLRRKRHRARSAGSNIAARAHAVREIVDTVAIVVAGANHRAGAGIAGAVAEPLIRIVTELTARKGPRAAAAAGVRGVETDVASGTVVVRAALAIVWREAESDIFTRAADAPLLHTDVVEHARSARAIATAAHAVREIDDFRAVRIVAACATAVVAPSVTTPCRVAIATKQAVASAATRRRTTAIRAATGLTYPAAIAGRLAKRLIEGATELFPVAFAEATGVIAALAVQRSDGGRVAAIGTALAQSIGADALAPAGDLLVRGILVELASEWGGGQRRYRRPAARSLSRPRRRARAMP